jgi:hypothetical protein
MRLLITAFVFVLLLGNPAVAQSEISGGFGLDLGSELEPKADGGISLKGYNTTNFSGEDTSGIFSMFFAAVTPTTKRVAAVVGFSDGSKSEQWCESTAKQLAGALAAKYGEPLDNVISIEAFRRGDLYNWRRNGRQIELACRSFGLMEPFYVQIFYTDETLMDDFQSESLAIENGEMSLDNL